MRIQVTIAFLLGAIATMLGVLVFGPKNDAVLAQASSAGGGLIAVGGNSEPGGRNYVWVIDAKTDTPHLALYEWEGSRLVMHASRNIKYDLELVQFPGSKSSHQPSVQEIYRETEKARREGK